MSIPRRRGPRLAIDADDTAPLAFNNAGSIALNTVVRDGEDSPGIFVVSHTGTLEKSVGIGDPTPVGGTFSVLFRPSLNNAGDVVFQATVADGTVAQGIFLVKQGQVSLVVAEGAPTPIGGQFALQALAAPPLVNDRGEVAFNASVMKDGKVSAMGTFLFSQGQIKKAMVSGDPSPLGGTFLQGPVVSQLSNTGAVVFVGIVDTDGDGNPNNQGIFSVQPFSS